MNDRRKALSVLVVSTLAFTVCFMVWMMFAVIGIPLKKTLGLNATEFGLLTAMPVLSGLAHPRALGHLDRQVRRPHRHGRHPGRHGAGDLVHGAGHPVLAAPPHRPRRRRGRRLVLGGHAVCRALVPAQPPGLRDGRVRRRQLGRRREQVRRPGAGRRLRLDDGAACLRGDHARHAGPVLAVQLQRPGAPGAQQHQVRRPAEDAEGPERAEVLPVLQHRLRRLRGAEPVDGAVLRRRISASTSAPRRCWRPASPCPAACCAPSAAGCRTSTARTASPGG